jgi:hypothetical protein
VTDDEQLEDAEDLLEEEGDSTTAAAQPTAVQGGSPAFKAGAEAFALQCAPPHPRGCRDGMTHGIHQLEHSSCVVRAWCVCLELDVLVLGIR